MPIAPDLSRFSLLVLIAPRLAPPRGMQFGASWQDRPPSAPLPPHDLARLRLRLAPVIARLEQQRAVHLARAERELRLWMGASALAGLLLGVSMGGLWLGLALMAGAALFALLVRIGQVLQGPRQEVRHAILGPLAEELARLVLDPDPRLSPEEISRWRLLPPVRKVSVDLRLTGRRDGQALALYRVGVFLGGHANVEDKPGDGLTFVAVEIGRSEPAAPEALTVLLPTDAPAPLRQGPGPALATGDPEFDSLYEIFGDPAPVTPALLACLPRIEGEARAHPHTMREVPAGTGLRPSVALWPGRCVVLIPLAKFDGAFEPPPFWQPLDAETLIRDFAADLAVLDAYLTAALSLPLSLPVGVPS